jgi:hypothetical protein
MTSGEILVSTDTNFGPTTAKPGDFRTEALRLAGHLVQVANVRRQNFQEEHTQKNRLAPAILLLNFKVTQESVQNDH